MKKQLRTLIILVAVAALLTGSYFVIKNVQSRQAAEESSEDSTVYLYTPDTISTMTLTNSSGTYAFAYDSFHMTWSYSDNADYSISKDTMDKFANELMQSKIVRTLDPEEDLDAYGLKNPAYTLALTDGDGNPCTFYFGNQSGDGTNYYVMKDGESAIYNVNTNIYSYLKYTVLDCVVNDNPTLASAANTSSIEIRYGGNTYTLNKLTSGNTSAVTESSATSGENTATYTWQLTSDAVGFDGTSDKVQTCVAAVVKLLTETGVSFTSCVDYDADDAAKASYGLDGSFTVTVNCTDSSGADASWTLIIGSDNTTYDKNGKVDTSWYYANLDGTMPIDHLDYRKVTPFTDLIAAATGTAAK